jgi:hypothetical protein
VNDIAVCDPVPTGGRVRKLLNELDLKKKVSVGADGLACDAGVIREFYAKRQTTAGNRPITPSKSSTVSASLTAENKGDDH